MTTTNPAPYRINLYTGGATLNEWHGEQLGYLPRACISPDVWLSTRPVFEAAVIHQRKAAGQRRGSWVYPASLQRHEGKEALLLFWGLERATPEQIPAVIANWRGLAPEERWWLATQADATRGTASYHPERGWRAAIVHILTENGV